MSPVSASPAAHEVPVKTTEQTLSPPPPRASPLIFSLSAVRNTAVSELSLWTTSPQCRGSHADTAVVILQKPHGPAVPVPA